MAESASSGEVDRAAIAAGTLTIAAAPKASTCNGADQKVRPGGAAQGLARSCRQCSKFHARCGGKANDERVIRMWLDVL